MSFFRVVRKTLAVLLVLGVALYLVVNLGGVAKSAHDRSDLSDEVTVKLRELVPIADQEQSEMVAAVGAEPAYAWIAQSCVFSTDDTGWTINNYRETCVLRSVQAWPVASEAEALAGVGLSTAEDEAIEGCTLLGPVGGTDGPEARYVDGAADPDPWCLPGPSPWGDQTRGVVGEPTTIPPGTWLLVQRETPLIDEPIGCARWLPVVCSNPWNDHAFGVAP